MRQSGTAAGGDNGVNDIFSAPARRACNSSSPATVVSGTSGANGRERGFKQAGSEEYGGPNLFDFVSVLDNTQLFNQSVVDLSLIFPFNA